MPPDTPALPRDAGPVTLRRLRPADAEALLAIRADPEVARYQSWAPMDLEAAGRFVAAMASAPLLAYGEWCQIALADSADRLVGDIGLYLSEGGEAEIGITLARAVWGRGWGTAGFRTALALVFADSRVQAAIGAADARNTASLRMLEKAGLPFSHSEENTYDGERCTDHVYRLTRAAFDAGGKAG